MKNVIGGDESISEIGDDEGNCKCANGTASGIDACSITTPNCARKCACGKTCTDQGNERGSICK